MYSHVSVIGMKLLIFMSNLLAWQTCLAEYQNCSENCGVEFTCCKGSCQPCFNCQLYLRQGGQCTCSSSECGPCLKGYTEITKTRLSSTVKACKIIRNGRENTVKCMNDETCPRGKYCFDNMCVSCFNCKIYHREQPDLLCAKDASDCGNCIDGYYEVPITRYSKLKSCSSISGGEGDKLLATQKFLYSFAFVLLGGIVCTAFFLRRNGKETIRSHTSGVERSHTPIRSCSCAEETVFTYISQEKETSNVAAYVNPSSGADCLSSLDTEDNPVFYDDEETIPSTWSPNASAGMDDGNASSFSGFLDRIREADLTETSEVETTEEVTAESNTPSNAFCDSDNCRKISEIEIATQEIHIKEDTKP